MDHHAVSIVTGGALAGRLFAELLAPGREARAHEFRVLPCGTLVGAYEIDEPIGRGGGGTVYRASRADGRYELEVAVKVLASSTVPLDRAITECRALAQLSHPAIPKILDAGSLPDGRLWFAMELVKGHPIDQYFERENASFDRRIEVMRQICDAFAVAHAAGVVHRDVKPSNLLIDERGHPKIIDFGIASLEEETVASAASQLLTPAWASPEQLRGEATTAGSDIHQLGTLLDRLQGEPRSTDGIAVRTKRRNLQAVIRRATADTLDQRYANVRALREDLDRVSANLPAHAQPWGVLDRTRFVWMRHARLLMLLAFMLVAASILAVRNRVAIEETEQRASGAVTFIGDLIERADPARGDGTRASAVAILDEAAALLTRRGSLSDRDRLSLATRIVTMYVDLEEPATGAALAESILASRPVEADPDLRAEVDLRTALATAVHSAGDADDALQVLATARSLLPSLAGAEQRGADQALKVVEAGVAVSQSRYDDANDLLQQVFEDVARHGAESQETLVLAHNLSGVIQTYSAPAAAAEQFFAARDLAVGLRGSCSYCAIVNDVGAAQAVSETRDFARALELVSRARAEANRYMTRNGVNHKVLAMVYRAEGEVLMKQGDGERAEIAMNEAIEHLGRYDDQAPELAKLLITKGRAARDGGRQQDALAEFRRAVRVATDAGARASPFDLLAGLNESAKSELALGLVADALQSATALEAKLRSIPGADSMWTCAVLLTVAKVQLAGGDPARTTELLDELLPHLQQIAADSPRRKSYEAQVEELRASVRRLATGTPAIEPK